MKGLKTAILSTFLMAFICSCNYHYYTVLDTKGERHRFRDYKSQTLQDRYHDRMIVKYRYKKETHFIDSSCITRTDTLIDCDSIMIFILIDSKDYTPVFTKGIVSCKLLSRYYGANPYNLIAVNIKTGDTLKPSATKSVAIRDAQILDFIKRAPTRKIIKFKITPYTFYMELTNEHADKKTKFSDFINGAQLTWFCKGPFNEI